MSSHVTDLNTRNKLLTGKLLHQGYRYQTSEGVFKILLFYYLHYELVSKFKVGLKSILQQGLSEPEFYGNLVYKLRKTVSRAAFSDQFRNVIMLSKRIGYNVNVMRQSACLVITQSRLTALLPALIARRLAMHQTQ